MIYVASRASIPARSVMWRHYRDSLGVPINSSWIDEAGEDETEDFGELWNRIQDEIRVATGLVFYAEQGDLVLGLNTPASFGQRRLKGPSITSFRRRSVDTKG